MSIEQKGFRLSPQQRQLLLSGVAAAEPAARLVLDLEGEVDAERLRRALVRLVERHEVLRTGFRRAAGARLPLQVPAEEGDLVWSQGPEAPEPAAVCDLEHGPLLHARLIPGAGGARLVLGLSPLVADRRSLGLLAAELVRLYAGEELADPVQYIDFSEWQNDLLADEDAGAGLAFWQGSFRTAWTARLLRAEQAIGEAAVEAVSCQLDVEASAGLDGLAERHGATAESLLMASLRALLARLGAPGGALVGTLADGRLAEDLAGTVGLLAKPVPVAGEPRDGEPFSAYLRRVEEARGEAIDWQSYLVPPEGATEPAPAPPVVVEVVSPPPTWQAGGLTWRQVAASVPIGGARLRCEASQQGGAWRLQLEAQRGRFAQADLERLARSWQRLLIEVASDAERAVDDLDLLAEVDRRQIVEEWNRSRADYPADLGLHALISAQAARTPAAIAVRDRRHALPYAELERRAEELARSLVARGVGQERRVALLLERSTELVVAMLGVLKAGGAYVPVDPSFPAERIAWLLGDCRPVLVVTRGEIAQRLGPGAPAVHCIDGDGEDSAAPGGRAPAATSPESLAYVLYTSGSTGRPKGVMVSHRAVVNYLSWALVAYRAAEGSGAPVHSPIGFDLTVTSLFAPLLAGGCVELLAEDEGVESLGALLARQGGWSFVKLTPAHLDLLSHQLQDHRSLADRAGALVIGGEPLSGGSLELWQSRAPATRLINEYGPTEATVGCTWFEASAGQPISGAVPIGRPIANARIFLVDRRLRPVPIGAVGEILIAGDGLARGYLGRPAETAERFVPDPFATEPGGRVYRTGDLARFLPSLDLEFLGRADHQVKFRGVRIEVAEIEAALVRHADVAEAVVSVREDVPGDRRLVAYYRSGPAAAAGSPPQVEDLRSHLATELPEYMLPTHFVALESWPLTANGKVDRGALPAPGSQRPGLRHAYVAPRDEREQALCRIWAEVLGLERVGIEDGFFALGGDSIRSVRAVGLAKEEGIVFTVQDLFRHQTPAAMAAFTAAALEPLLAEIEALSEEEAKLALTPGEAQVER
ncbi:MAG TPA: amino acid adenylation domain-containing protein [Thermoanaerobaculia bacterium]|nr:amino acid adenylation domain-containing protein [Thermoanaerobaculia bacterium]